MGSSIWAALFLWKLRDKLLLQITCIKAKAIAMRKQRRMALGFLATHFLLILSAASPDLHNAIFHYAEECSQDSHHVPCHSHGQEEGELPESKCPVVLFSESSELSHSIVFVPDSGLIECKIPLLDSVPYGNRDNDGPLGARAPPLFG
jgi:hypothetical protein